MMRIGKTPSKGLIPIRNLTRESLHDFVFRGPVAVHAPVEDILWGFYFAPRTTSGSRWLHAFGQLLLAPDDSISAAYGRRIPNGFDRGHEAYPVDIEGLIGRSQVIDVMLCEGMEVLNQWNSLSKMRASLVQPSRTFRTYVCESSAILAAREGDFDAAIAQISTYEDYIRATETLDLPTMLRFSDYANLDRTVDPWEWDRLKRLGSLKELCLQDDKEGVQSLLNEWRAYTIAQLGIEDICLP